MLLVLFAEALPPNASEVLGFLQTMGPAGLAGIAIWWLTNRHEAIIKTVSDAHIQAFKDLSEKLGAASLDYKSLAQECLRAQVASSVKVDEMRADLQEVKHGMEDLRRK